MKKAIFGLGCFWGPEEKFSKLNGITNIEVGYCGGNNSWNIFIFGFVPKTANASYKFLHNI